MDKTFFSGKVAVVTGAGGTLASVIAEDLALKGAKVVLIGRTQSKLEKVAEKIRSHDGICRIMAGDVNDEDEVREIADKVKADWGPCSFLINGAGGNNIRAMTSTPCLDKSELRDDKPEDVRTFFDLDMDVFSEVVRTNIIGVVTMVRTFGRQMAEEGKGSILNFGSMNSYRPLSRVPAYALSKAAVVNLTQWLAAYLAGVGIRVNAVAPGFILNDRSIQYLGSEETGYTARGKSVLQHTPMHRFGQPTELLGCVEWLLNDEVSGFITGITVPVDGGFLSSAGI